MKLKATDKRVEWEDGQLDFPFPVLDAIRLDDSIIVIHDYMAYPRNQPARNLVAYSLDGKKLWTAENLTKASPTDAYAAFLSEEPLWVASFEGFRCRIDPSTGRLLENQFTK